MHAGLGGTGAELNDVLGRAALPGTGSVRGGEAEIAAEIGGDLGGGPRVDLVVEVGAVQPLGEFGVQVLRLFGPDLALDALAGGDAVRPGRCPAGLGSFAEQAKNASRSIVSTKRTLHCSSPRRRISSRTLVVRAASGRSRQPRSACRLGHD